MIFLVTVFMNYCLLECQNVPPFWLVWWNSRCAYYSFVVLLFVILFGRQKFSLCDPGWTPCCDLSTSASWRLRIKPSPFCCTSIMFLLAMKPKRVMFNPSNYFVSWWYILPSRHCCANSYREMCNIKDVVHPFMLCNICLMMEKWVAFFYVAFL